MDLNIDLKKIEEYELKISKKYNEWSTSDKLSFLLDHLVKDLDKYVEKTDPLSEQKKYINALEKLGFEMVFREKYHDIMERDLEKVYMYNKEKQVFFYDSSFNIENQFSNDRGFLRASDSTYNSTYLGILGDYNENIPLEAILKNENFGTPNKISHASFCGGEFYVKYFKNKTFPTPEEVEAEYARVVSQMPKEIQEALGFTMTSGKTM